MKRKKRLPIRLRTILPLLNGKYPALVCLFLLAGMVVPLQSSGILSGSEKGDSIWNTPDIVNICDSVPLFSETRILALSPSVPGSRKLTQCNIDIIKRQLEKGQAGLVLLELEFIKSLPLNRYVQGDTTISKKMLEEFLLKEQGETEPVIGLAEWIRGHNETAANKVALLGMDPRFDHNELYQYLPKCLAAVNSQANSILLDALIELWKEAYFGSVKKQVQQTAEFKLEGILGFDTDILLYYCRNMPDYVDIIGEDRFHERDSNMYRAASFLIDSPHFSGKQTIIQCHLMHGRYYELDSNKLVNNREYSNIQ